MIGILIIWAKNYAMSAGKMNVIKMIAIEEILQKHSVMTLAELNNFCIENNIDIIVHNGKPFIEFDVTTNE